MEVDDPERSPPLLEQQCRETVTKVEVTQGLVERLLQGLDVQKATGPDNISPHVLKQCARKLAVPPHHSLLCLLTGKYLALSVERGPGSSRTQEELQFGFRPGPSTSDLLMLLTGRWQDALDGGLDSVVVALDIAGAFDRVWHGGLLEKLRAKGIQGDLLQLLGDYLQGRTLQVVVNGQASESLPVRASVPQDSVLGPVLWNIYVDDLLRQLPAVSAYADDCTLSCTYPRHESVRAAEEINQQLGVIQEWGTRWQVTFAPEKTQAMVVSRSPAAEPAVEGGLSFGGLPLELQEYVKILGVEVDRGLRFDRHVKHIALKASHRLDGIQRRALRLVEAAGAPAHPETPVDTLEHRRDVAALVVFHKAQVQGVPHLAGLRLPTRVTSRDTRTVSSSGDSVKVPRSLSSQHQRTFWGRVSRLWNGRLFQSVGPATSMERALVQVLCIGIYS
ncbi:uncharacterized protein LOC135110724 [Scylla paramamosain]|uniref:uncharacterized protein LOC135110724 n=1 Tax=Scylla paramamosain TaxID=85552 RepID=UPI003082A601